MSINRTPTIYYYKNNRKYFRRGYSVVGIEKGTRIYSFSTGRCIGWVGQNTTDVFDKNDICVKC